MRGPPVLEGAGGEEVGGVAELRPPPPLLPPLLVPGTPDPPPGTPGPPSLFRPLALALSVTWSAKSWVICKKKFNSVHCHVHLIGMEYVKVDIHVC